MCYSTGPSSADLAELHQSSADVSRGGTALPIKCHEPGYTLAPPCEYKGCIHLAKLHQCGADVSWGGVVSPFKCHDMVLDRVHKTTHWRHLVNTTVALTLLNCASAALMSVGAVLCRHSNAMNMVLDRVQKLHIGATL